MRHVVRDHDLTERKRARIKKVALCFSIASSLSPNPGFSKTRKSRETTERREVGAMRRTKRGLLRRNEEGERKRERNAVAVKAAFLP